MATNSELIRQWFEEVWNQGREATIDELCAREAIGHGQTADGSDVIGPEHFKQFWHAFRAAFTSIHVEIHQTMQEGELALARWTLGAEHTGPFLGIAPTGKTVQVNGMSVQRFVGGKIMEAWDNWDQLALMTQIGAVSLEKIISAKKQAEARIA